MAAEQPLRVLLLEDVEDDARLVVHELRRAIGEADVRRVDERSTFLRALQEFKPQLILSDHRLAGFSGMDALQLVRAHAPDTPFIFVTGSLDEETAVESIKAGAWDYVLKDRLVRLGPAVSAALELKRTREALQRSQEQLLQAQKMDALGRLAGGVAHDYNNVSTAILGYCELLAATLDLDDPRREDIEEIRRAAERAAGLTRQLLAFSRKQIIEPRPVRLNDVVSTTRRLLDRLIGEDIRLTTQLAPDLGWVHADAGQLEQVIVNLVVNARDAMPGGGEVVISTANITLGDEHVENYPDARPGPHIMLSVSDTGHGMDAGTMERVFEPFFTTKPRGQGTGLGLSTVYGIVKQSGGHVVVESTVGQGTTVRVFLPEIAPTQSAPAKEEVRELETIAGTENILLVEDNASVRNLTRRLLESFGYHVIEASTGKEAIALSEQPDCKPHLLLTDVVMPEMSGLELARQIAQRHPGIRVICMSGYTDDEILRQGPPPEGIRFLQKPFTADLFARTVRSVLDSRP